jgi:hypothetical protein
MKISNWMKRCDVKFERLKSRFHDDLEESKGERKERMRKRKGRKNPEGKGRRKMMKRRKRRRRGAEEEEG